MVALTDGMAAYRTYPHVDRHETGLRAAEILTTVLERGRPTGRALRKPDLLIPLNFQCTLDSPPKDFVAESARRTGGGVRRESRLSGEGVAGSLDIGGSPDIKK